MSPVKNYFNNIIRYDYISKFNNKNLKHFPTITKIVLNFDLKNNNEFDLISSILALELISNQKPLVLFKKFSKNLNLRIKAGSPVGCSVTLRKDTMFNFLINIFLVRLPESSIINNIYIKSITQNNICFNFKDLSTFSSIEDNYYLFKYLNNLKVSLITNSKNYSSILFLTGSLKIPLKRKVSVTSSSW